MTLTLAEAAMLLARCAASDQRTVGEADIAAWCEAAHDHRWSLPVVRRIVREHYGAGADRARLTPAAVTDRIRQLRGAAAESFDAPRIPEDLPNAEYPRWLRARLAEHIDAQLARWAHTGQQPDRALPSPETVGRIRTVGQLAAAAPPDLQPQLRTAARRIATRRRQLDPARRSDARAELDAIRRAQPPEAS